MFVFWSSDFFFLYIMSKYNYLSKQKTHLRVKCCLTIKYLCTNREVCSLHQVFIRPVYKELLQVCLCVLSGSFPTLSMNFSLHVRENRYLAQDSFYKIHALQCVPRLFFFLLVKTSPVVHLGYLDELCSCLETLHLPGERCSLAFLTVRPPSNTNIHH